MTVIFFVAFLLLQHDAGVLWWLAMTAAVVYDFYAAWRMNLRKK